MKPFARFSRILGRIPLHFVLIFICVLWLLPTLGLFVTSFRAREDVRTSGWWTAFVPRSVVGQSQYETYCSSCHGADGKAILQADLSDPVLVEKYPRSNRLLAVLRKEINGAPHLTSPALPEDPNLAMQELSEILSYMRTLSGTAAEQTGFTLGNYTDALVGYKGTQDYITDCQQGVESTLTKFNCNVSDLVNDEGMGRAFINTLLVAIPSTFLPVFFAALAAYAFSWMDFRGRTVLFALLVGLQIIPLQMTLVPIARMYADLGMEGTFVGIWLFHTGFGLPYAIYLLRNFLSGLPREMFESAYLDGANHWTAFRRLAIPLTIPAIASLSIFQFLWIWNDFLVAKIFLSNNPVLTVQITNLIDARGGNWHIMTGAAFLSFIVPMFVFFRFQRYFVRGMLAGSVKG